MLPQPRSCLDELRRDSKTTKLTTKLIIFSQKLFLLTLSVDSVELSLLANIYNAVELHISTLGTNNKFYWTKKGDPNIILLRT